MPSTIEKACRTNRAFLNERFVYESAFPDKPELIEVRQPQTLVLKKVEGIPYLDSPVLKDMIIAKLAKAIGRLHAISHLEDRVLCHWDNQPRNILWAEQKQRIFLLDFEDIRLAPPEADLAHLFLFWAEVMASADFTRQLGVFLGSYKSAIPLDADRWKAELRKAKYRFDRRREKYCKMEKLINQAKKQNRKLLSAVTFL
jgi:tRNA A-37 threonylcarbamoyl transferase component Bud32